MWAEQLIQCLDSHEFDAEQLAQMTGCFGPEGFIQGHHYNKDVCTIREFC